MLSVHKTLQMNIHDAIFPQVWYSTAYSHVWPCLVLYSPVQFHTDPFGLYGPVWPRMAQYGPEWSFMVLHVLIWSPMVWYGPL